MRRATRTALAVATAVAILTGCSDDEKPDDPAPAAPSASPTDAGPEDVRGVRQTLKVYDRALASFVESRSVTPELEEVTTEAWAEQLLRTYDDNIFSTDLEVVGRYRTDVRSVQVADDVAQAVVCADGSKVYVVERGAGTGGSEPRGRRVGTVALVNEDGTWKVDGYTTGENRC